MPTANSQPKILPNGLPDMSNVDSSSALPSMAIPEASDAPRPRQLPQSVVPSL